MATLQPKHYKAIELFEEGMLSIREIASACDIPLRSMYDLFEGNTQRIGDVASLFKGEVDKLNARSSSKIRYLVKDNKKIALRLMNDRLKDIRKQRKVSKEAATEIQRTLNSLAKTSPQVEVGQFNVSKGMTAEELKHEFRRLSALADFALKGGSISRLKSGGGLEKDKEDSL